MSEKVVSLNGGRIEDERRAAFVQAVGMSYDLYHREYGFEPDAVVYVLCGVKQPSHIAWDIRGDSMGGPTSILSVAATHCAAEAQASRQGLPE